MWPLTRADFAVLVLAALVNRLAHSDMCNWMFACGCKPLWAGGWTDCNIHSRTNPHCPWCVPWLVLGPWYHLWKLDSSFEQDGLPVLAMALPFWLRARGRLLAAWLPRIDANKTMMGCFLALVCASIAYVVVELFVGACYTWIFLYPDFILSRRPLCEDSDEFVPGWPWSSCREAMPSTASDEINHQAAPGEKGRDSSGLEFLPSVVAGTLGGSLWALVIFWTATAISAASRKCIGHTQTCHLCTQPDSAECTTLVLEGCSHSDSIEHNAVRNEEECLVLQFASKCKLEQVCSSLDAADDDSRLVPPSNIVESVATAHEERHHGCRFRASVRRPADRMQASHLGHLGAASLGQRLANAKREALEILQREHCQEGGITDVALNDAIAKLGNIADPSADTLTASDVSQTNSRLRWSPHNADLQLRAIVNKTMQARSSEKAPAESRTSSRTTSVGSSHRPSADDSSACSPRSIELDADNDAQPGFSECANHMMEVLDPSLEASKQQDASQCTLHEADLWLRRAVNEILADQGGGQPALRSQLARAKRDAFLALKTKHGASGSVNWTAVHASTNKLREGVFL